MTIENTIKEYIVSRIFNEFPTISLLNDDNAFDVYVNSDDLAHEYILCEEYEDNITDDVRSIMEEELNDLMELQTIIINKSTSIIQINKDEIISDSVFEELSQVQNANIHRAGTNDEFITFNTINLGDM